MTVTVPLLSLLVMVLLGVLLGFCLGWLRRDYVAHKEKVALERLTRLKVKGLG